MVGWLVGLKTSSDNRESSENSGSSDSNDSSARCDGKQIVMTKLWWKKKTIVREEEKCNDKKKLLKSLGMTILWDVNFWWFQDYMIHKNCEETNLVMKLF